MGTWKSKPWNFTVTGKKEGQKRGKKFEVQRVHQGWTCLRKPGLIVIEEEHWFH